MGKADLSSQFVIPPVPYPPAGGMTDPDLHLIFNIVLWSICAVFIALALRDLKRTGSPLSLLVLAGGGLCMLIEPIVDVMGLCWFWPQGQTPILEAFGRPIPNWMLPTYIFFVGGQALYTAHRFERGISSAGVFKLYAIYAAINVLLEEPPLHMGLYHYYGPQPLQAVLLPLWWLIPNAAMPMVLGAMIYQLKPRLRGAKMLLILPLMPMGDALTNGAVAWPVWLALNTSDSVVVTTLAALLSLSFGLIVMWVLGLLVAVDSPARAASAARLRPRGSPA